MLFNNSSLFRLVGASWVRLLAITLGVLLAATVAALLGAFVFVVVSIRVPAVLPDPAGFAELLNRRQASLASDAGPALPTETNGGRTADRPDPPSSRRGPAQAAVTPFPAQSPEHSAAVLLAGQAAPVIVDSFARLNVLILGVDAVDRLAGNTDVIMLLSADPGTGSIALISFPRDLCVADCNRSSDRLNGIYSRYGAEAMLQIMTELTGQPITYYAVINFDGFARIIDRLGGVDIIANRDFDDFVPNPDGSGHVLRLARGENHLNGRDALMYARSRRYDASGDFARICRQQQIVASLISSVLRPASLIDLPSLLLDLGGAVETNLPIPDLVDLLQLALRTPMQDIAHEVILNDGISGTSVTGSDGSYLIRAEQDAIRANVGGATARGAGDESTSPCPA